MAFSLTSPHAEKAKIDQIVSEFFAKSLHVILDSRIPFISIQNHPDDASHHSSASTSTTSPTSRSSNRWFNLEMDNCAIVIESADSWRRGNLEPLVVDILLQQPGGGDIPSPSGVGPRFFKGNSPSRGNSSGDSWSGEGDGCASPGGLSRTLLERWVVQYVPRKKVAAGGSGSSKVVTGFGEVSVGGGGGSSNKGVVKGIGGSGPPLPYPSSHVVERPVVYKRTVIMLRSLYCTMRTLPAHRLFRLVNSSSHSRSFTLSSRVSSAPPPLSEADETAMMTCSLTPVETMWGRLCISVAYRHTTAVTALEIAPPILPRIIPDYVGSPTTDPLRRFNHHVGSLPGGMSGRRGVHVISLPCSVPSSPPGTSFPRQHSWSVGQQKFPLPVTSTPSLRAKQSPSPSQPPDFHPSPHSSSPSTNLPLGHSPQASPSRPSFPRHNISQPASLHHIGNDSSSQPVPIHEQSPSFCPSPSPSPSPSPPTPSQYPSQEGGLSRGLRSAPVSIPPRPSTARPNLGTSPRLLLPEGSPQLQARSQYPPPSPNRNIDNLPRAISANSKLWTGQVPNLFLPSLDGRATQRLSISTLAESSLLVSPPHPYHQVGEERDDGPPSGVKRSLYVPPRLITLGSKGPKSGSQDDADEEFFFPFAVEREEAEDYRSRMESPREVVSDAIEQTHQWSQDAAVGALVRILKSAPPLRHWTAATPVNSGSPSPRPILPPSSGSHVSMGGGKVKNSPPRPVTRSRSGSISLVGSPSPDVIGGKVQQKTSAFALEELRGYIEMRDHLLRQSGGKFQSSSPAKHM